MISEYLISTKSVTLVQISIAYHTAGSEYMEGVDQTDGPSAADVENETLSHDEIDGKNTGITVPIEADYFFAYSTVPGYFSWRNNQQGSWFVQSIVRVFNQHALTMDIQRMMTRVNNMVAKQKSNTNQPESSNKRQIPSIVSQLRKDLYFFPGHILIGQYSNTIVTPQLQTPQLEWRLSGQDKQKQDNHAFTFI